MAEKKRGKKKARHGLPPRPSMRLCRPERGSEKKKGEEKEKKERRDSVPIPSMFKTLRKKHRREKRRPVFLFC